MQDSQQDQSSWNVPCRDANGQDAYTVVEVTGDEALAVVSPLLNDRAVFTQPHELDELRDAITAGQARLVAGRQIHHRRASLGTGSPGTGAPAASRCDAAQDPGSGTP